MNRPDPRPRSYYRHFQPMSTRWNDNDLYGHVNNAIHYSLFDSAVNAWMIERGLLELLKGDLIALVVETSCRYFAPLAFPKGVEIGMRVAHIGGSSITWHLGTFEESSAIPASEGHFTHVIVGRDKRRPVPMPDQWRQAYQALAG